MPVSVCLLVGAAACSGPRPHFEFFCDVRKEEWRTMRTALHYAAMSDARFSETAAEIVKVLLKRTLKLSAVDSAGYTALHYAAENNQLLIVQRLMERLSSKGAAAGVGAGGGGVSAAGVLQHPLLEQRVETPSAQQKREHYKRHTAIARSSRAEWHEFVRRLRRRVSGWGAGAGAVVEGRSGAGDAEGTATTTAGGAAGPVPAAMESNSVEPGAVAAVPDPSALQQPPPAVGSSTLDQKHSVTVAVRPELVPLPSAQRMPRFSSGLELPLNLPLSTATAKAVPVGHDKFVFAAAGQPATVAAANACRSAAEVSPYALMAALARPPPGLAPAASARAQSSPALLLLMSKSGAGSLGTSSGTPGSGHSNQSADALAAALLAGGPPTRIDIGKGKDRDLEAAIDRKAEFLALGR
jgi:hypothetical protein